LLLKGLFAKKDLTCLFLVFFTLGETMVYLNLDSENRPFSTWDTERHGRKGELVHGIGIGILGVWFVEIVNGSFTELLVVVVRKGKKKKTNKTECTTLLRFCVLYLFPLRINMGQVLFSDWLDPNLDGLQRGDLNCRLTMVINSKLCSFT